MTPEFSRPYRIDTIGTTSRRIEIAANAEEREALARRFGLVAIDSLSAQAEMTRDGETITAAGKLQARAVQSCVASGEPVPEKVDEAFRIEFRPQPRLAGGEEEIELGENELDVIFYDGGAVDLGEAVAETLSLALDPYPRSDRAEEALREAGVKSLEEAGPFAALKALKDKMSK